MYLTQMREKFQTMEGLFDSAIEIEIDYYQCWDRFINSLQALTKNKEEAAPLQAKISQILENKEIDFESTESIRGALDDLLSLWQREYIQTNKIGLDTLTGIMTKDPAILKVLSVYTTVTEIRVKYDNKAKEWSDFFARLKDSMVQATSSLQGNPFASEQQSECEMLRAMMQRMVQFVDELPMLPGALIIFSDAWSDLFGATRSMLQLYHKQQQQKQKQYAQEFLTLCNNILAKPDPVSLENLEHFTTALDKIQTSVRQPLFFETAYGFYF